MRPWLILVLQPTAANLDSEAYQVTTYEPLQTTPCIGSGLRVVFSGSLGEPDYITEVVAMAVCRVRHDWYRNGRFARNESVEKQICGIFLDAELGFGICEESGNFARYLGPGETGP